MMRPLISRSLSRRGLFRTLGFATGLVAVESLLQACAAAPAAPTAAPAAQPTSAAAPTAVAAPPTSAAQSAQTAPATVSGDVIKLGRITAFTGPFAASGVADKQVVDLVKDQVQAGGGILGKPFDVDWFDGAGDLAQEVNGFKKFGGDPTIAASAGQGFNWAGGPPMADLSNQFKLAHFTGHYTPDDLTPFPYVSRPSGGGFSAIINKGADFVITQLKPKSAAILADNQQQPRDAITLLKQRLDQANITVTSEQYIEVGAQDVSPFITKALFGNPDAVLSYHTTGAVPALVKQVGDLGGWGNAKYFSMTSGVFVGDTPTLPGAQGTFHMVQWAPGLPDAGSQKFEKDFTDKYGKGPTGIHLGAYLVVWTALTAIKLAASTDHDAIAKVARSGKVSWDAPGGTMTILPSGENSLLAQVVQLQDGKPVPYWK